MARGVGGGFRGLGFPFSGAPRVHERPALCPDCRRRSPGNAFGGTSDRRRATLEVLWGEDLRGELSAFELAASRSDVAEGFMCSPVQRVSVKYKS
mmetsp:Transcript_464/g.1344  ORF Transcript_464/g.1344 Transcript_464/m.1344 type:complete len:95 (+) Transcript_464:819-1103(+)